MTKIKVSTDLSTEIVDKPTSDKTFTVDNSSEIYKSNKLIESSYRLTTAQNRLLYMGMSKLKRSILDKNMNIQQVETAIKEAKFDLIYIDVIDYKRKFNIKANNLYEQLSKIANELYEQEIIYFDENDNITRMRWVITCKYDKSRKGISLQFHPDLIKDLLIFKNKFTRMIFDNFVNIKGKYSFRIYELCKQYLIIGHRDFYVEDIRFKLGIKDSEYKSYSDLKKSVLNTSIKEISKNTDINIEFEEIERDKKTRKVKKIRFIIKQSNKYSQSSKINKKNDKQIDFFKEITDEVCVGSLDEESIVEKLSNITSINLTAGESEAILSNALEGIDVNKREIGVLDYIKEKVKVCVNYSNNKEVKNSVGLLIKALIKNWTRNNTILDTDYKEAVDNEKILINGMSIEEFEQKMINS